MVSQELLEELRTISREDFNYLPDADELIQFANFLVQFYDALAKHVGDGNEDEYDLLGQF